MVGMHERFHDTINLAKRKPRRLSGTPARRVSFWLAVTVASLSSYGALLLRECEFVRASRERWMFMHLPDETKYRRELMLEDPCLKSVLTNLEQKQMKRVDSLEPADRSPAVF